MIRKIGKSIIVKIYVLKRNNVMICLREWILRFLGITNTLYILRRIDALASRMQKKFDTISQKLLINIAFEL